jgi:hypothetical protein
MKLCIEKGLNFGSMIGFSTIAILQLTKPCHAVSDTKTITEMEHTPYSPDLALKDFWLFPKTKPAFKGRNLRILKT